MLSMIFMLSNLCSVAGITTSSAQDQQSKKKKARKEAFKVDFDAELDVEQYFSKSRVSITIFDRFVFSIPNTHVYNSK